MDDNGELLDLSKRSFDRLMIELMFVVEQGNPFFNSIVVLGKDNYVCTGYKNINKLNTGT